MTRPATDQSGRANPNELPAYARDLLDLVEADDALEALEEARHETYGLFRGLEEDAVAGVRYADGKWTIKEIVGHLVDVERILVYRALSIARGDERPLRGFDEDAYMVHADFEARTLGSLLDEHDAQRWATLAFARGLPDDAWRRTGTANGESLTVRGILFFLAAHELHHHRVVRERYLPLLG